MTAGSDFEVTVTFAPQEEDELSGAIEVTYNADNTESPSRVTLDGTGIVDLADPPGVRKTFTYLPEQPLFWSHRLR